MSTIVKYDELIGLEKRYIDMLDEAGKLSLGKEDGFVYLDDYMEGIFDGIDYYVENAKCESCKHFINQYAPICSLGVVSEQLFDEGCVSPDFGCNKFELKDKNEKAATQKR